MATFKSLLKIITKTGQAITCDELPYDFITVYKGQIAAHLNSSIRPIWFFLPRDLTKQELSSRSWKII